MNSYKVLNNQTYTNAEYSIVPIRYQDRMDIMQWRNEQIFHLRQSKPLSVEDQDNYFNSIVSELFGQTTPNQILFSYLKNDTCIGYGGLVHINWIDKHAEISFIMQTSLEAEEFGLHWGIYLNLIERVAFQELEFHKLFTYAFDVRPFLYTVLENSGFVREAVLKDHCSFNGKMKDVLIHSKWNNVLKLEPADQGDLNITFEWAKDSQVRKYAFNKSDINFEEHRNWFLTKLSDNHCSYWILKEGVKKIGSIRIDYNSDFTIGIISYLIDPRCHGKGFGAKIIKLLEEEVIETNNSRKQLELIGYVIPENLASISIFRKLNYEESLEKDNTLKFRKQIR